MQINLAKSARGDPGAPGPQPDSEKPIFGLNDVNAEKLATKRAAAKEIQRQLLEAITAKKRDALLARLEDQRDAEKMLARNADE